MTTTSTWSLSLPKEQHSLINFVHFQKVITVKLTKILFFHSCHSHVRQREKYLRRCAKRCAHSNVSVAITLTTISNISVSHFPFPFSIPHCPFVLVTSTVILLQLVGPIAACCCAASDNLGSFPSRVGFQFSR